MMVQLPPELPSEEEPDDQWLVILLIVGGLLLLIVALAFLVSPRIPGDGDAHKENKSEEQGSHPEAEPGPTPNKSEGQRNVRVDADENDNSGAKENPSPGPGATAEDETDSKPVNIFSTLQDRGTSGDPGKKSKSGVAGQGADFFGITAEGSNFVYVIDKSSSMIGGKFIAAQAELIQSIDKLTSSQKVFVIFFDANFHLQPTKSLVSARNKNISKIKEWIYKAYPGGSTKPFPAVQHALSMNPDAVFVLSDGEFAPGVVDMIRQANRDFTIPIHTIAFRTNAKTLRDIAAQNRGTYRYVP